MIKGVFFKKLEKKVDDRGFFMEILRSDDHLLKKFGQFSVSLSYPGTIKAFHYHLLQDDLWFFAAGNAQVVLYDRRVESSTYKETNVFFMGEHNPSLLLIPAQVAHGYKVIGNTPVLLTYLTTEAYQASEPDEFRIPWNDPQIGFDWGPHYR